MTTRRPSGLSAAAVDRARLAQPRDPPAVGRAADDRRAVAARGDERGPVGGEVDVGDRRVLRVARSLRPRAASTGTPSRRRRRPATRRPSGLNAATVANVPLSAGRRRIVPAGCGAAVRGELAGAQRPHAHAVAGAGGQRAPAVGAERREREMVLAGRRAAGPRASPPGSRQTCAAPPSVAVMTRRPLRSNAALQTTPAPGRSTRSSRPPGVPDARRPVARGRDDARPVGAEARAVDRAAVAQRRDGAGRRRGPTGARWSSRPPTRRGARRARRRRR